MINVKQELIKALKAQHQIPVRAEETRQGFEPPCFYVAEINAQQQSGLQDRYYRTYSFDVQYHARAPEERGVDQSNAELEAMGELLAEELVFLAEPKLAGKNISYRVVDKVLHFLVDYRIGLKRTRTYPKMQQLHEEVGINERDSND